MEAAMDRPLEVTVLRTLDGAEIRLSGRLDRDGDAALADGYAAAVEAAVERRTIVLDFEAVDYINSTGIALIVGLLAASREDGHVLHARGLSDHYREIFRITRLTDYLTIDDTAAGATTGNGGTDG
jgi:anti-anti-sigma factor